MRTQDIKIKKVEVTKTKTSSSPSVAGIWGNFHGSSLWRALSGNVLENVWGFFGEDFFPVGEFFAG